MDWLIYELGGIVLIVITCFIHKHTFIRDYEDNKKWGTYKKSTLLVWQVCVYVIIGLVPIINGFAFGAALGCYVWTILNSNGELRFSFKDISGTEYKEFKSFKWVIKLKELFTRNLNN